MGGKNLDQFQARQKSKTQKVAKTGTELSRNPTGNKKTKAE
ncbi:MAG: hypothetical protein ABFC84_07705 [Veillonellales bacterium]